MLMSHLHTTLRALLPSNRTIDEVVTTASSTFCQSALPAQFATLVLGQNGSRLGGWSWSMPGTTRSYARSAISDDRWQVRSRTATQSI
jgi:hypothetical protein